MLSVKNVVKKYGEKEVENTVLNSVSFDIDDGEICTIIGPSGSGKSTLLNLIGGLDSVESGSINAFGTEVLSLKFKEKAVYRRKYLGYIFQFYNLVPNLTVSENIRVCKELAEQPMDMDELIKLMGLWEHKDKFPSQLSGGQQQRCAIARALVKNPRLLLCDEPTGALDSKNTKEVMCILKDINKKYKTTILIVTHNELICKVSDRIIGIVDGRIIRNEKNAEPVSPEDIEWA